MTLTLPVPTVKGLQVEGGSDADVLITDESGRTVRVSLGDVLPDQLYIEICKGGKRVAEIAYGAGVDGPEELVVNVNARTTPG